MPLHKLPRATNEILQFLSETEALRCQQLDKWMYERGVPRSWPRFKGAKEPKTQPTQQTQLQPQVITHNPA